MEWSAEEMKTVDLGDEHLNKWLVNLLSTL